ncbi:DUF72 domain-containing protein [Thermogladius sp. 4427co]|uniref:DUF72 domain-containing protein n=1 Tax=Thermogladius sp. 4427co TaxID=3450718 RepID=UPI003F7AE501
MGIKIGCCGFPVSRKKYYGEFNVVELQNTFYDLPSIDWAENLRSEAPGDFEFTIKAWQVITHPASSPTWKKMRRKPRGDTSNYGFLKPSNENLEALRETVRVAEALKSKIIVLQTPPSLPYSRESVEWVREFFSKASDIAQGFILGWEPRGEWSKARELYDIIEEFGIVHIVDPFRATPHLGKGGVVYFRLHGIGGSEVNYRYKYTDDDLKRLHEIVSKYSVDREVYVLFNNVYMFDDAARFKRLINS